LSQRSKLEKDATFLPSYRRVRNSAKKALFSLGTWLPLAGGLAIQTGNLDEELSAWAVKHKPVYGSKKNAAEMSTHFANTAKGAFVFVIAAEPIGDDGMKWATSKLQLISVEQRAKRLRPNQFDTESLPSLHTSRASVYASLASWNLNYLPLSKQERFLARSGLEALRWGTGWARVETNVHYPSDVLVGAAIGNFFAVFFSEAFLGLDQSSQLRMTFAPAQNGFMVNFQQRFDLPHPAQETSETSVRP